MLKLYRMVVLFLVDLVVNLNSLLVLYLLHFVYPVDVQVHQMLHIT